MKAKTTNGKIREQFDENGNFVCPTCKKPLKGLHTSISESLVALDRHTSQKHKVQCCSEECTAKFFEKQSLDFEE